LTGKSFTGLEGVVTGWGAVMQHGATSDVLNEVTVPIMSNKECRMTTYGQKRITDNMMCAGFPEGKKDSCQVSIRCILMEFFSFKNRRTLKDLLSCWVHTGSSNNIVNVLLNEIIQ
jgi:hypothetical protein